MADKVSEVLVSPSESEFPATERLRAMLDERGIKHNDFNDNGRLRTFWAVRGIEYSYVETIYPDGQCETLFSMNTIFDATPEQAIAATVGRRTDLTKRLREVTGLHAFAELFGFDWEDGSDWTWHDVACAMADAVDAATVGTVPETKYLMALDEAREAQRKLEMCQTSQKVYQSKCRSLKETNADLCRIIDDMKAATVGAGMCHMEVKDNLAETDGMGDVWLECDECHWQMPLEPATPRFKYCPNCGRPIEVSELWR